jgi:tRNA (adenine37-N6)-methyltransferase
MNEERPPDVTFRPIGIVRSENVRQEDTPVQPTYARGIPGRVEVFSEYAPGLDGLEAFSHVYLLCHLNRTGPWTTHVVPFLQSEERGVFATRAPSRPNAIGLSIVRLVSRDGNILNVEDVDLLDGTPLLDIKPFVGGLDEREGAKTGRPWNVDEETARRLGSKGWKPRR